MKRNYHIEILILFLFSFDLMFVSSHIYPDESLGLPIIDGLSL